YTHDQPANNADDHDEQCGDRIAADKLTGPVHRPIELCFLTDFLPSLARFVFTDQARVQVRVNRHLFARHGVQGEASPDFSDPPSSFGNHDKVDDHQNNKDNDADCEVAAHQKM